ncbi:cyanamide hydratase family HD domain-containing protein [Terfezia boudieri ATCC MYA-4762]|uniref:Cyanamide hydratase family HD domain-containing protein n=1 Tax=Terfezia boudieri ATCC MYA-4762 TaxID=1051890 RepID=A0A3N4L7V4_9PEZI|nr:cyanamide hydratase family HD domain-containing protein [Terfezia boudieri ATCC MYA-4762]
MDESTAIYGLLAVPASVSDLQPSNPTPATVPISSLNPPTTALATRVNAYVKSVLPFPTYAHSMRVYCYGTAIGRQCFPEWGLTPGSALDETYFLTAMLHDIGTTDQNISSTKLSYDFFAGVLALDLLQQDEVGKAPRAQAESVAEAIFRHQDVQDKGMVTLLTQLIQMGTLLDNIGAETPAKWVTRGTIEGINKMCPRKGWSECFRKTVDEEKRLKPYAMVSRIQGFEEVIKGNKVTTAVDE